MCSTTPYKTIAEQKKKARVEPNSSIWQGRQDSNLRPSVLETDALPLSYVPNNLLDFIKKSGTNRVSQATYFLCAG